MARALESDGHEVVFATSESYGKTVEKHGFNHVSVGLDYTQGSVEFEGADATPVEQLMFFDGPPVMYEDLSNYFASSQIDVVLADPTEFGSMVAAEAFGVPLGSVVPGRRNGFMPAFVPFDPEKRADSFLGKMIDSLETLRQSAGLSGDMLPGEAPYDRTFSLCMAPESFNGLPPAAQHHTSHPLRPEIHHSDSDDAWLDDLPTDLPVVAVSFGTLFGSPELYEDAITAILATDAHVVASTSFDIATEHDRLTTTSWVSMDRLMKRADVSVHHGGWGSTVAAIASGTPSVVVPIGADQFTNAQGIKNTGAGVVVGFGDVKRDLEAAVRAVVADKIYELNARRLQNEIESMPAAPDVIPLIQRLAEDGVVFNKPMDG